MRFVFRFKPLIPLLLAAAIDMASAEPLAPAGLERLILPGTQLLAFAEADLDGDGTKDVVFILEKQKAHPQDADIETGQRPLFIALRDQKGQLRVVKRNDRLVLCSTCGGVFGDPFAALEAKTKRFSINHYGGSNWRWSYGYDFAYSRIDRTWQLVRVEETTYHTSNPDAAKTQLLKPPRDFGKIDVADFDPEHYRGVGPR